MVQISRGKLSEELLFKIFELFFQIVGKKNKKEEFLAVIEDLFSPVERIMIAKRIAIIYLLLKKVNPTTICQVLKVSSSTVAKYSVFIDKSVGITNEFKKLLKKEKIATFLEDLYNDFFNYPGRPGINWSASWKIKNQRDKERQLGI